MAAMDLLRYASYGTPCTSTLEMDFHPCVTFDLYCLKCSSKSFVLFPVEERKKEQNKRSELSLCSKAAPALLDVHSTVIHGTEEACW